MYNLKVKVQKTTFDNFGYPTPCRHGSDEAGKENIMFKI